VIQRILFQKDILRNRGEINVSDLWSVVTTKVIITAVGINLEKMTQYHCIILWDFRRDFRSPH